MPGADAIAPNNVLLIQEPPGDDLGLGHNEQITLQVRYQTQTGERLPDESVEFSLVATGDGEDTVGSILSAARATTDGQGLASVELVAGAQDGSFRVSVDARDAPTAYFYIAIADGGFTSLRIAPVHEGWRAVEAFTQVEVRLYRPSQLTCAELDIDELPASLSPPRTLDGFGDAVEYQNVATGQAPVVVAWSQAHDSEVRSAFGCVEIAAGQLPTGLVELDVVVADRSVMANRAPVRSTFDLAAVDAHLDVVGANRPWQILGCPLGPGHLLLDCAVDAEVGDGALDCRPTGDSGLSQAIEERRGVLQPDGCRADQDAQGQPSLEQLLTDAVAAGGSFPVAAGLDELLAIRRDIAGTLVLDTQLTILSEGSVEHGLATLSVTTRTGAQFALDLGATSRPVLVQRPVSASRQGAGITLADHGFTLRYGAFGAQAFAELALTPLGLAGQADALGSALAASAQATSAGCTAVSELVCAEIGQNDQCLRPSCEQGVLALDGLMSEWWRAMAADGLDFRLAGTLVVRDDDGDLQLESLEVAPEGQGVPWAATLTLTDGTTTALE